MATYGHVVVFACVVVMTIGQILFKEVASAYNDTGSLLSGRVLGYLLLAGSLYVGATGMWIWALRSLEISKAYPYFALGFVFVPLAAVFMFGEVLTTRYVIGVCLIISGVWLTTTA